MRVMIVIYHFLVRVDHQFLNGGAEIMQMMMILRLNFVDGLNWTNVFKKFRNCFIIISKVICRIYYGL